MDIEPAQLNKTRNILTGLVLASGGFFFGYHIGVLNPLGEVLLVDVYNLSGQRKIDVNGLLNSLFCIGVMIGVLGTGVLADKIGRRPVYYASDFVAIIAAGLFLVQKLEILYLARFVIGLASGLMVPSSSIIMSELLPKSVSGFSNSFTYSFLVFAILVSYLTPYVFTNEQLKDHHGLIMAFPVWSNLLKLILTPIFLKSETPKYAFLSAGENKSSAKEQIANIYSSIYEPSAIEALTAETIESFEKQEMAGKPTWGAMFSEQYRKRTISGVFVAFAQQISGINFLVFYSSELFKSLGKSAIMTVVIGLANFFGSFLAVYAVGKFGRKFNIVWGVLFQAFGMFLLFLGFQLNNFEILAASVTIFVMFFAVGLGGSQMAYTSEILPPAGISIALAVQWILTAAIGQFLPNLMSAFGGSSLILFFTIACAVFFLGADYLMIETKGKSEDQISNEFELRNYTFLNFK